MNKEKEKNNQKQELNTFKKMNHNAAGIDIGSKEHWVAIPPNRSKQSVRKFGCFTEDIHEMAKWLKSCQIETVAMKSTGIYWIAVFQILESHGFEVYLVSPRHIKHLKQRKTDIADCQWLQKLHTYGMLQASFQPEDQTCSLRCLLRQRDNLIKRAAVYIQQMQKALLQMNIQLSNVVSDITGVDGLRIIDAIVNGERDPEKLVALCDNRMKGKKDAIIKSLKGNYRPELVFTLAQSLELFRLLQKQINDCQLEACVLLKSFKSKAEPKGHSR